MKNVSINDEYHREFKIHCAEKGYSMTGVLNQIIVNYLIEEGVIKV